MSRGETKLGCKTSRSHGGYAGSRSGEGAGGGAGHGETRGRILGWKDGQLRAIGARCQSKDRQTTAGGLTMQRQGSSVLRGQGKCARTEKRVRYT